ncbi:RNA polymerase sigma factor [Anatilimnocola sp. NA78]|uniref:RNA polymerase sigma factor n=1 Tax=Anatilimnocola sp. NA78 TaxID=3415683 RepID=UPI003CE50BC0
MKATLNTSAEYVAESPVASLSDEQLLLGYRNANESEHARREWFAELVHRYERELFNYLRRYLGDAEQADDAFQATFLQVHLKRDQFEAGRSIRPWLYTLATHQAIDLQRRNKRHRMLSLDRQSAADGDSADGKLLDLLASNEPNPAVQFGAEQRRQWLNETIAAMPAGFREALELVYFQDLKYREAADVLGVPVGTVKSRVHSAVLKLTEAWNERFPGETLAGNRADESVVD